MDLIANDMWAPDLQTSVLPEHNVHVRKLDEVKDSDSNDTQTVSTCTYTDMWVESSIG